MFKQIFLFNKFSCASCVLYTAVYCYLVGQRYFVGDIFWRKVHSNQCVSGCSLNVYTPKYKINKNFGEKYISKAVPSTCVL